MKQNSIKVLSALALGLVLQGASAGSITGINVSVLPDNQRVVKVRFDKDAVEPSGFITGRPARIALDFPGTNINMRQNDFVFRDTLLNGVVTAEADNYSRVLLNLSKESQYNTKVKGNEVWIYVAETRSTNTASKSVVAKKTASPVIHTEQERLTYAKEKASSKTDFRQQFAPQFNVDFHKNNAGSGVIELAHNYHGEPKVKKQGDLLIITLENYPLAIQDQRHLDVTDFSTPVRKISVKRLGNDAQITIHNQGMWKHNVSGSNGRQTIQISADKSVVSQGMSSSKAKSFKGKVISLDFQNIDVRTILQILAKESGMNIVASDSVQGKMTISLKDVPWDQALDLVLDARALEMKRNGNIINVAPRDEMMKKTQDELEMRNKIQELGPLLSQTFQLKYKKVEEFRDILKLDENSGSSNSSNNRNILSNRGSALIDPTTNTLIVTDNEYVIRKFEKLIEELDVAARQVMVEARIVEASDGVSRDLGVKFGAARSGKTAWGANFADADVNSGGGGLATGSAAAGALLNPNVNLPVSAAVNSISLVRRTSSSALGLELAAMEMENRSKTISTPRVLTQDRKEAIIEQGFQIPYTSRDEDGTTETEFKSAVMSLKVIPQITPDNKIILDVEIKKEAPDYTRVNIEGEPGIETKSVKTQAMIEDGGTLVVGGIYQEVFANRVYKVPVLGDMPVLGNLFKSRSRSQERNELLFFITPRIMGGESSVLRY